MTTNNRKRFQEYCGGQKTNDNTAEWDEVKNQDKAGT
jgi:hypothetical protein